MNKHNLILLGPQGSGKSTQAKMLVQHLGMIHVDMGSALRTIAKKDTYLGRQVNEIMNVRKELVSDELVSKILHHVIGDIDDDQGIILDGAPRKESQIQSVERVLADYDRTIDKAIFINIPTEVSVARIASRFACSLCSKAYVIDANEQLTHDLSCSECGGQLEQRVDDTPEGVRKRLAVFAKETTPVIEHYRAIGKLLEVDGTKTAEEIYHDIVAGILASIEEAK
ncbi:MAG: nucleoside monophosphate kinase [Candidatus Moranbacteria bacterium]|nr:nucleoside monophosphate kinase [Candidatus Moranbacteria bacterium]